MLGLPFVLSIRNARATGGLCGELTRAKAQATVFWGHAGQDGRATVLFIAPGTGSGGKEWRKRTHPHTTVPGSPRGYRIRRALSTGFSRKCLLFPEYRTHNS